MAIKLGETAIQLGIDDSNIKEQIQKAADKINEKVLKTVKPIKLKLDFGTTNITSGRQVIRQALNSINTYMETFSKNLNKTFQDQSPLFNVSKAIREIADSMNLMNKADKDVFKNLSSAERRLKGLPEALGRSINKSIEAVARFGNKVTDATKGLQDLPIVTKIKEVQGQITEINSKLREFETTSTRIGKVWNDMIMKNIKDFSKVLDYLDKKQGTGKKSTLLKDEKEIENSKKRQVSLEKELANEERRYLNLLASISAAKQKELQLDRYSRKEQIAIIENELRRQKRIRATAAEKRLENEEWKKTHRFQALALEGIDKIFIAAKGLAAWYGVQTAISGVKDLAISSVQASADLEKSLVSLNGISKAFGVNINESKRFVMDFAADGTVSITETAQAFRNLLSAGYGMERAIQIMKRLKDAAAFNRQGTLEMGQAIVGATQGLKNQMSIMVDNAGITKNLSVMWKEYAQTIGKTVGQLNEAEKRQAEYVGIMKESIPFLGNAGRYTETFAGQTGKLAVEWDRLKASFGDWVTKSPTVLASIEKMSKMFSWLRKGAVETTEEIANGLKGVEERAVQFGHKAVKNIEKFDLVKLLGEKEDISVRKSQVDFALDKANEQYRKAYMVADIIDKINNVFKSALTPSEKRMKISEIEPLLGTEKEFEKLWSFDITGAEKIAKESKNGVVTFFKNRNEYIASLLKLDDSTLKNSILEASRRGNLQSVVNAVKERFDQDKKDMDALSVAQSNNLKDIDRVATQIANNALKGKEFANIIKVGMSKEEATKAATDYFIKKMDESIGDEYEQMKALSENFALFNSKMASIGIDQLAKVRNEEVKKLQSELSKVKISTADIIKNVTNTVFGGKDDIDSEINKFESKTKAIRETFNSLLKKYKDDENSAIIIKMVSNFNAAREKTINLLKSGKIVTTTEFFEMAGLKAVIGDTSPEKAANKIRAKIDNNVSKFVDMLLKGTGAYTGQDMVNQLTYAMVGISGAGASPTFIPSMVDNVIGDMSKYIDKAVSKISTKKKAGKTSDDYMRELTSKLSGYTAELYDTTGSRIASMKERMTNDLAELDAEFKKRTADMAAGKEFDALKEKFESVKQSIKELYGAKALAEIENFKSEVISKSEQGALAFYKFVSKIRNSNSEMEIEMINKLISTNGFLQDLFDAGLKAMETKTKKQLDKLSDEVRITADEIKGAFTSAFESAFNESGNMLDNFLNALKNKIKQIAIDKTIGTLTNAIFGADKSSTQSQSSSINFGGIVDAISNIGSVFGFGSSGASASPSTSIQREPINVGSGGVTVKIKNVVDPNMGGTDADTIINVISEDIYNNGQTAETIKSIRR